MAKWKPGQSGNPGGRPKGEGDIRELARQHTPAAIRTLVKVMNDENANHSAKVAASIALLDRAWGRPPQTINASIDANRANREVEEALSDITCLDLLMRIRGIPENTRETEPQPTPILSS